MKKIIILLSLLLCLGLSGCGEILAGSYQVSSPHADRPATNEDSSAIRVENYPDLVSAVLYLVSQGEEEGILQFYDYPGDVETALTDACLEVATQDPLGAYCVDYIRHELTRVVSYDQATLSIHYRRTMEQVRSTVNVTGTGAIRTELREALGSFQREVVLRVSYFDQDIDSITQLIRQAYYDNPVAALGFPRVEINLYPDSGSQRVVEILLTYDENEDTLFEKSQTLSLRAQNMTPGTQGMRGTGLAEALAQTMWEISDYDPQAPGTPYAALVEGVADDEGMALAYLLLCKQNGLNAELIRGTLSPTVEPAPEAEAPEEAAGKLPENREPVEDQETGEAEEIEETGASVEEPQPQPRWWVELNLMTGGESLYLDPSQKDSSLCTAQEFFDLGYRWDGGPQEPEPEPEPEPEIEAELEESLTVGDESEGSAQD